MPQKLANTPSRYSPRPPAGFFVLDHNDLSDDPMEVGADDLVDASPVGDPAVLYDRARKPASAEDFRQPTGAESAAAMLTDLVKGVGKGAVHTGIDIAGLAQQSHMIPGISQNDAALKYARDKSAYGNNAQRAGGAIETLAELAVPVTKAAGAVPSLTRAGAKFENVMAAARSVPIDIDAPGRVALRISELAERGGSMPVAVRKFLARVTDPDKGAMVYEEARDFASNISRLSANEYGRLTPAVAREVAELRVVMNQAVAEAAAKAGKASEYASAMREYAHAAKLRDVYTTFLNGVKKGAPYATAAGAGTWLSMKLKEAFGED